MSFWKLAVAVVIVTVAGFVMPAHTQAPPKPKAPSADNVSELRVCNVTPEEIPIFTAILYRTAPDRWRLVGWYGIEHDECMTLPDKYPLGVTFFYAEDYDGDIRWEGNDAHGCVHPVDGFDRTITGPYECEPGERSVGFTRVPDDWFREGFVVE